VAARPEEFNDFPAQDVEQSAIARDTSPYGDDGYKWKPYLPDPEKTIGQFALEVLVTLGAFEYDRLPVTDNMRDALEEACKRNESVIVVVDAWTIRLRRYHTLMQDLDLAPVWNYSVIVPLNDADNQTQGQRALLERCLRKAFRRSDYKLVDSSRGLKPQLRKSLKDLRMKIINLGIYQKPANGSSTPLPYLSVPSGRG
jgi:FxsC-like protein